MLTTAELIGILVFVVCGLVYFAVTVYLMVELDRGNIFVMLWPLELVCFLIGYVVVAPWTMIFGGKKND